MRVVLTASAPTSGSVRHGWKLRPTTCLSKTALQSNCNATVCHGALLLNRHGAEGTDLNSHMHAETRPLQPPSCRIYVMWLNAPVLLLTQGISETVRFVPGVPVKPMLAKPMTGVSEVLP